MFIQNKYYRWYMKIIINALSKDRTKAPTHDNHHIMPKSVFPEHIADDWNLVFLTHKEHYVCHHLLTKCLPVSSMTYAFHLMIGMRKQRITARVHANLRRDIGKIVSERHTGKILSAETKRKISDANMGKIYSAKTKAIWSAQRKGKSTWNKGKKLSAAGRKKLSEAHKGRKHPSVNGHYVTPWGKFLTAGEAYEANDCLLHHNTIRGWCKDSNRVIQRQSYGQSWYIRSLGEEVIGKTFKEIGFYYELF